MGPLKESERGEKRKRFIYSWSQSDRDESVFCPNTPNPSLQYAVQRIYGSFAASPSLVLSHEAQAEHWSNKKSHFLKMSQQPSEQITAPRKCPTALTCLCHRQQVKNSFGKRSARKPSSSLSLFAAALLGDRRLFKCFKVHLWSEMTSTESDSIYTEGAVEISVP